ESHLVDYMFQYRDTIWLRKKPYNPEKMDWYYLNDGYQLVYVDSPDFYRALAPSRGECLFEDSAYIAYKGCAGEFGGTIFFYSKTRKKTYSFPATCPSQVLFHDNA